MSLSFITFLKEAQLTVCDIDPAQQHHLRRWGCLGMQIVVPTLDLLSQNGWRWFQDYRFYQTFQLCIITLKFEKHCFKASEELVEMQIAI